MKSPTIYKCSPSFTETWWIHLEKAGFAVEQLPSRRIVRFGKAIIAVHSVEDGHLMIVFSAPFVFWGKNLQLAKRVGKIFMQHCADIN